MCIYEVVTEKRPWSIWNYPIIVERGDHPKLKDERANALFGRMCAYNRRDRPSLNDVIDQLSVLIRDENVIRELFQHDIHYTFCEISQERR